MNMTQLRQAIEVARLDERQISDLGKHLEGIQAAMEANDHDVALHRAQEFEGAFPTQLELLSQVRDAMALTRWAWVLQAFDTPEALCEVGGLKSMDETGVDVSPWRGLVALAAYRMHQRDFTAANDLMDEWVSRVWGSGEKEVLTRLAAFRDTLQAWADREKLGDAEAQAVLTMSPSRLRADIISVLRDVERSAGLASLRTCMQVPPARFGAFRPKRKLH